MKRRIDGDIFLLGKCVDKVLQSPTAENMKIIAWVVFQVADYLAEGADALLLFKSTCKADVGFSFYDALVGKLGRG